MLIKIELIKVPLIDSNFAKLLMQALVIFLCLLCAFLIIKDVEKSFENSKYIKSTKYLKPNKIYRPVTKIWESNLVNDIIKMLLKA